MIAGVQLKQVIGPLVDGRIYPLRIDENEDNTPPYIIYQEVSTQPELTDDGPTGHEWTRQQIDVYHPDKYEVRLFANKVVSTINNQIKPSIYGGQQQLHDEAKNLWRQSIDYEFWQTTPTE
jgi:hypothetical protein